MALTCTAQALSLATGGLRPLSKHELQAALVRYLYLQKNPSTADTVVIPAASLLASASCLSCTDARIGRSKLMDMFQVWIQRQAAIDAGWSAPATLDTNKLRASINGLANLSDEQLRAIEILLRCQLA